MAVISVSHHNNITYWATINSTGWSLEMQGMREILSNFAMIPMEDVQGNQDIVGKPMTMTLTRYSKVLDHQISRMEVIFKCS